MHDEQALDLMTDLASLMENIPPRRTERDLLIYVSAFEVLGSLLEPALARKRWNLLHAIQPRGAPQPLLEI